MIETLTVLTLTLAKAFGVYIILVSLVGLFDPARWAAIVADLQRSPALTYIAGITTFALGLALLIVHPFWTDPLAIIITVFGWVALLEGVILTAAPDGFLKLGAALVASPRRARAWAVIGLVTGAALLGLGLMARAQVSL
jgi:hypothetical protein